ncbi:MAG: hypothetical protein H8D45_22010 [Bacteroidetes bacterium]|nr:hypothetical protein [Bacteroidota bacterium]MBL7103291.1 hypothetical protein [Bacteroidales bacterium]
MSNAPDRLQELLIQDQVTGLDFVYVHENQVALDVYFLRPPNTLLTHLVDELTADQIHIYSVSKSKIPVVPVEIKDWADINGRHVLRLKAKHPGDFTYYNIFINDPRIDDYFNDIVFSFKANCPNDLDCKPPDHVCPPEQEVDFPIDYNARDFWSFRNALLEFASFRYPDWKDRNEADVGNMLAEVMSALGDELAYYQDRIGREAYLETASQRRSYRRHALLVDYIVHDGLAASTWLDVTVHVDKKGNIKVGTDVWALGDNGQRIDFEVGKGLFDRDTDGLINEYYVHSKLNSLDPYIWDEDDTCLFVGTTELYIDKHYEAYLTPFDDLPPDKVPGKWALLKTTPSDPSIPARRHMIRIIEVKDVMDSVLNKPITHIRWEQEQELPFEMDLNKNFEVRCNMVPLTAGIRYDQYFIIGEDPDALGLPESEQNIPERAIERLGHDNTQVYLNTLKNSDKSPLVWLEDDSYNPRPEIRLVEVVHNGMEWVDIVKDPWEWRRTLVGTNSSQPGNTHYVLDDGSWKSIVNYQRDGTNIAHYDYASNEGLTIRFGDGEFGMIPEKKSVFRAEYRLGGGKKSNVAADTLTNIENEYLSSSGLPHAFIDSVTNPLPATNGLDPETVDEVRQLAPEAFRAVTYRAVRPEDYAEAAERLSWVQNAGASLRWTGSWLSVFVTPDPTGKVTLSQKNIADLNKQLDRFRQAGRETHVKEPVYADLNLEITVCVSPDAYRGEVKERILESLFGVAGISTGYFSPDNFTFGTTLERSSLDAVIQSVEGVKAVERICFERKGWFDKKPFADLMYDPGANSIIRIENDSLHPERGTVKLSMKGGA